MHEIVLREFGLARRAQVILRPTLPSVLGLQTCAIAARQGHRVEGWYSSGQGGLYAPATAALVMIARISGCRIPFHRYFPTTIFPRPRSAWLSYARQVFRAWCRDQSAHRYD